MVDQADGNQPQLEVTAVPHLEVMAVDHQRAGGKQ